MGTGEKVEDGLPLGKNVAPVQAYSPDLLFPIPRAEARESLPMRDSPPFVGEDLWTGYELSWLDRDGKPSVGIVTLRFPFDSPNIIESKSLKLYLNSLYTERFDGRAAIADRVAGDLSLISDSTVAVDVFGIGEGAGISSPDAILLDDYPLTSLDSPDAKILGCSEQSVQELLVSHLLRSLCPVTGQPDWATVYIQYKGHAIDCSSRLSYIVSYREHQDFHEHCVEQIFCDLWERCKPEELSVYARYLRRGGLDINPWRSSVSSRAPDWRNIRQ